MFGGCAVDVYEKLKILSEAAKYDASCSSSGSNRKNSGGLGNASVHGVCHSFTQDGRCVSLLKVLMSNKCIYDCKYCLNRATNDVQRASFEPEEIAELTVNFYRRNYIEGLFLSSAVEKNPNFTMEKMLKVVDLLRNKYKYYGYIHAKGIPGADERLIQRMGMMVDRMSVNIELPSEKSLGILAPQKNIKDIFKPMAQIKNQVLMLEGDKTLSGRKRHEFVPGGQSTQMIIGASPESDKQIAVLTENLYKTFDLKRVYFSAYIPVNQHPSLPTIQGAPLLREHRLYQIDWLLRFYGFEVSEIFNNGAENLDLELDPKVFWALNNLTIFPLEVNKASYDLLLKIPGIGVKSAQRILAARKFGALSYEDLKKIGVVLKRAKFFLTCNGKFYGESSMDRTQIRSMLLDNKTVLMFQQLNFLDNYGEGSESNAQIYLR